MTIRTSLYPMGYRQTGSPQPTGDTPGNLLGVAYCFEDYDDSDIVMDGNDGFIDLDLKEDVYRYNVDLSNYSGNADKIYITANIFSSNLQSVLDERSDDKGARNGIAIEIWVKNRPDKDNGIEITGTGNAMFFCVIPSLQEPEYPKGKTVIYQCLFYRESPDLYVALSNIKILEI